MNAVCKPSESKEAQMWIYDSLERSDQKRLGQEEKDKIKMLDAEVQLKEEFIVMSSNS